MLYNVFIYRERSKSNEIMATFALNNQPHSWCEDIQKRPYETLLPCIHDT